MKIEPGQVFGHLTVIGRDRGSALRTMWACLCVCGRNRSAVAARLVSGTTKSCGCITSRKGHLTHGASKHPLYGIWKGMRDRCNNPKNPSYSTYGGRGISVCKEWDDFTAFLKDMGARPEGMSLDRKDNSLGYSKGNCQWATKQEQANNQGATKFVEYKGEKMTLSEFSRKTGLTLTLVLSSLRRGVSPEDIVIKTPL